MDGGGQRLSNYPTAERWGTVAFYDKGVACFCPVGTKHVEIPPRLRQVLRALARRLVRALRPDASKRQKDLADIMRLLEAYPELKQGLPREVVKVVE